MSNNSLVFTGSAFLLFGGLIFFKHLKSKRLCKESERWPFVEGAILTNEIESFLGQNSIKDYQISINFEYEIQGKIYVGRTPACYDFLGTEEEANEMGSRFKVGEKAKVFYNPKKHNQAVLITGGRKYKEKHEFAAALLLLFFGSMQIIIYFFYG